MPKISVEIPVTWGTHLGEVLEALRVLTFQDFEVCAASSLGGDQHRDLLNSFGAKSPASGPNTLEERFRAHGIEVIRDPERCLDGADDAVLATEWEQFRKLEPEDFLRMRGRLVYDTRRVYDTK